MAIPLHVNVFRDEHVPYRSDISYDIYTFRNKFIRTNYYSYDISLRHNFSLSTTKSVQVQFLTTQ